MFIFAQAMKSKAALEVPWNHIETGKQTHVTQVQTSNHFWACEEGPHSPSTALACLHQLILTCVIPSLPLCAPCIYPLGMEQDARCDLERSSDRKPPVKKPRLPPKRNKSLDFPGTVLFCVCVLLGSVQQFYWMVWLESTPVIRGNFSSITCEYIVSVRACTCPCLCVHRQMALSWPLTKPD